MNLGWRADDGTVNRKLIGLNAGSGCERCAPAFRQHRQIIFGEEQL